MNGQMFVERSKKTKETDLLVNKMDDLNVKTCNVIFAPWWDENYKTPKVDRQKLGLGTTAKFSRTVDEVPTVRYHLLLLIMLMNVSKKRGPF